MSTDILRIMLYYHPTVVFLPLLDISEFDKGSVPMESDPRDLSIQDVMTLKQESSNFVT